MATINSLLGLASPQAASPTPTAVQPRFFGGQMPMVDDEYFRRYFNVPGTYGYGAQRFLDQTDNMPVYVPPTLPQYEQRQFIPGVFDPVRAPAGTPSPIPPGDFAPVLLPEIEPPELPPVEELIPTLPPPLPPEEIIKEPKPAETSPVTEPGPVVTRELPETITRGLTGGDGGSESSPPEVIQEVLLPTIIGEPLKTPIVESTIKTPEGEVVYRSTDLPYGEIDIKPIPIPNEPINPEVLTPEIEETMPTEFPQIQDFPLVAPPEPPIDLPAPPPFEMPEPPPPIDIPEVIIEEPTQPEPEIFYGLGEQFVGPVEETILPGFEAPPPGFTEPQPSQAIAFPVASPPEVTTTDLTAIDQELAAAGLPGLLDIPVTQEAMNTGLLDIPVESLPPEVVKALLEDVYLQYGSA